MSVLGAGVSATGAAGGGIAQGNAASYQAQIARNNATTAENNAQYASAAGQQQAQTKSLQEAETANRIKVGRSASGIDVNSGSAVAVQEGQREVGALDSANVLSNADLQSYGYRVAQTSYDAQAGLDEATAEQAPIGGALTAAGGLLSSASAVGTKFPPSWLGNTSLPSNSNGQFIGFNV